jgi:hypothetical protein
MVLLCGVLDSNAALDHELDRQTSNKSPSLAHAKTELDPIIKLKRLNPTSGPASGHFWIVFSSDK